MYAVIRTGGRQFRVSEGEKIKIEKIAGDPGAEVTLDEVLLVGQGKDVKVGRPIVKGAKVEAKITRQGRDRKIIVFKMKRRKNYHRKHGHRQPFTELEIVRISA